MTRATREHNLTPKDPANLVTLEALEGSTKDSHKTALRTSTSCDIFSTFASRKRSFSTKQIIQKNEKVNQRSLSRALSKSKSRNSSKDPTQNNFNDISVKIKDIMKTLNSHSHKEYEKKIRKLQEENLGLKKKIEILHDETRENSTSINELKNRIQLLEEHKGLNVNSSESSIKNRLLLKLPN